MGRRSKVIQADGGSAASASQLEARVEELYQRLSSLPLVAAVFAKLEKELNPRYTFHNTEHARDVLKEALRFALADNRGERELELLAIAAAYHDAGHLVSAENHEALGAEMARTAMSEYGGYRDEEIELVAKMILDTRIVDVSGELQRASADISAYLLDADLSNFGRADFFDRLTALGKERSTDGRNLYAQTLTFMGQHRWLTGPARAAREQKKQENIQALKERIKTGS